jgi:hypothetical protein
MGSDHKMRLQREQEQRTNWRWSESAMGQFIDATAKGARTTHRLEAERAGDGVISRKGLRMKQGRRTAWRCKGSAMELFHGYDCK